ncbi:MAG TPA: ABC-2 family transporter protein [Paenibacillus sp.]|jgi:ABC-2 type transport system permease protein
MLYFTLASKAYSRNLQYRGAHMVHNLASAMFGFIYASIWIGLGRDNPLGTYGTPGMISYICFTQSLLWITSFISNGLGIPQAVRTGQISLDLMRPIHLFSHMAAREWGQIAYQFVYKSLPIFILYLIIFPLHIPKSIFTVLLVAVSIIGAAYISICMNYLIGVTALWTTESSWFYWANHALVNLLAGFFIPLEWLPSWLSQLAWLSPYPYLLYIPTRIYLGYEHGSHLWGTLLWCVFLTLICLLATKVLRHKVEVQGG